MEQQQDSSAVGFDETMLSSLNAFLIAAFTNNEKSATKQRKRLTLFEKKIVVDHFYLYCKGIFLLDELPVNVLIDDFTVCYNNQYNAVSGDENNKLTSMVLNQWIEAERRGDYLSWDNHNNMHRKVFHMNIIVLRIDYLLRKRNKNCSEYNKVVQSIVAVNEYGVVARKDTPSGTFLGFYKGNCITPEQAEINNYIHNYDNFFVLNEAYLIDATDFISCYARYYKRVQNKDEQNVCVRRLLFSDTQKTVCFVTTKDVKQGKEFLIPFGCESWNQESANETILRAFCRVNDRLKAKVPRNYQQEVDTMFTCPRELQKMSLAFGDNHESPGPVVVTCYDSD
jgi:hypothetical protein